MGCKASLPKFDVSIVPVHHIKYVDISDNLVILQSQ